MSELEYRVAPVNINATIKLNFEQDIWYIVGMKKKSTIIQGKVKAIYINQNYQVLYVLMDCKVVWSHNDKLKVGEYVQSRDITNEDINKTAFLDKITVKEKIKEMRSK